LEGVKDDFKNYIRNEDIGKIVDDIEGLGFDIIKIRDDELEERE